MTNIYFQIISLFYLIMIMTLFFSKEKVVSIDTKTYTYLSIITLCMVVSDIIIVYISNTNPMPLILVPLNKIYLLTILYWTIIFVLYITHITLENKVQKKYNIIGQIIAILSTLLIVILPLELNFVGKVVTHTYGSSVTCLYIITLAIIVYIISFLIINKKRVISKKYVPIFILLFFAVITFIVRIIDPDLLLTTAILCYTTILMYHTIENPDIKMIEQLNFAKSAAEKANKAKSDFLSSMSHEIRTPLNAIVGLSNDLIDNEKVDKEIKEDVNDIVISSNTLLEIVGNIIDVTKIESNKVEIIKTKFSFNELVNDVVKINTFRLQEKNIKIIVNLDKSIPYELYGDRQHIKQIINNLISNAYKYTQKGTIKISAKSVNNDKKCTLVFSIEDTGMGIKENSLERLFNKFDRLDVEKNSTTEGTGLGMSITKELVGMLDGKLTVESIYGVGSLFMVQIPSEISILKEPRQNNSAKNVAGNTDKIKGKKILVVDDNEMNIKVASRVLHSLETEIDTCSSGEECIEKVKSTKYDVILMDIMMPDLDGAKTLAILKKDKKFKTPVIALTADATSDSKHKYIKKGFKDYISKPFAKEEIITALKNIL